MSTGDDARVIILGRVSGAASRRRSGTEARAAVAARLDHHPRNLAPAHATGDRQTVEQLFITKLEAASATWATIKDIAALPAAVASYLANSNLPARLHISEDLADADWAATSIEVSRGAMTPTEQVALNSAIGASAETGTLVVCSGDTHATGANFLPETHIAVLNRVDIAPHYEDVIDRLRARGPLPRTLNFITGPSRTGDIEQRIQLGAHGPRRLHVLVVG
jgi:L-lactate dehydrogenase complex protein LldG